MPSSRRILILSAAPLLAGLLALTPAFAADGAASVPRGAGHDFAGIGKARGGNSSIGDAWHWRGLRSGLGKKLDSGWMAAVNYTRAGGATERLANGAPRAGNGPAAANVARRALVLTLTRSF